jgi:hypothetical protein
MVGGGIFPGPRRLGRLYSKAGHPERTTTLDAPPRDPGRSLLLAPRKVISWAGLTGALYAAGRDDEAHDALVKWREIAVSEGGNELKDPPAREIMNVRLELALLRLERWPYTFDPYPHENLSRALFRFQADENLPQTGHPDEATLARLGITSQASAPSSE